VVVNAQCCRLRLLTALVIALMAIGCGSRPNIPPEDQVPLLTGVDAQVGRGGRAACWLGSFDGLLSADPVYGTRLTWDNGGNSLPVMWPPDFVGRRAGAEVEVLGPFGVVIAITGRRYRMAQGWGDSLPAVAAFRVCDTINNVTPLP
jgi:hypothetical protein